MENVVKDISTLYAMCLGLYVLLVVLYVIVVQHILENGHK